MHGRGTSSASLLKDVREDATALIRDPKRELKSFRLALSAPLGTKRGRGRGAAIDSVLTAVDTFYGEVLQYLKAWTAAPPKLLRASRTATEDPSRAQQHSLVPAGWPGGCCQPTDEQSSMDDGDQGQVAVAIDAGSPFPRSTAPCPRRAVAAG